MFELISKLTSFSFLDSFFNFLYTSSTFASDGHPPRELGDLNRCSTQSSTLSFFLHRLFRLLNRPGQHQSRQLVWKCSCRLDFDSRTCLFSRSRFNSCAGVFLFIPVYIPHRLRISRPWTSHASTCTVHSTFCVVFLNRLLPPSLAGRSALSVVLAMTPPRTALLSVPLLNQCRRPLR
jgi:hypothetical protein